MTAYIFRRVLLMIPAILLVTIFVFAIMRAIPGDPASVQLGDDATLEDVRALKEQLGLDKPFLTQYVVWLQHILRGDLGNSFITHRPVMTDFRSHLPASVELGSMAVVLSLCLALPLGVLSAIRAGSSVDYVSRIVAVAGIAVPGFVAATILFVMPSVWFGWSPPIPYTEVWEDPLKNVQQLILPAISTAFLLQAITARLTRSTLLNVMRDDYVRTAFAKGLRERAVVIRHALRNALIPVVTVVGNQVPVLISGLVISETVFDIPGMGTLLFSALSTRDYPIIQAVLLMMSIVVLAVNLLVDLSYVVLDPRVRLR
ncbi:MAG: ABC transporter permease [Dehalococcoidia bacterium]